MFEHTSRYYLIGDNTFEASDGRKIRYKKRRFLPQGERLPQLVEIGVAPGERLDSITATHLGDPLQFWQVCDANNTMNPFELVAEVGKRIRIPLPQFQEVSNAKDDLPEAEQAEEM